MAVKLQHHTFIPSSFKQGRVLRNSVGNRVNCQLVAHLDHVLSNWGNSRKKCLMKVALLGNSDGKLHFRLMSRRKMNSSRGFVTFASGDDGVAVNGSPQSTTSSDDVVEMRVKLSQSMQDEDYGERLSQLLHDAARVFELAIRGHSSQFKVSWFSTAWLGVDQNMWVKTLAYQASVYAFLQAACQIASRVDGRDLDTNIFVQRSLLRLSAPLESIMREKLSARQYETNEWFWSEQIPGAVDSFVNYFERDPRFIAATSVLGKDATLKSSKARDISLLLLALTCIAVTTKLGASKISCPLFFSMNTEINGSLMDILIDIVPIRQAYHSVKDIGLQREFLVHFGPQAAACRVNNDSGSDEVAFWVNLLQKQLQQAIDRERIWSKLTTSESIEVLEKDLAIFGFFIALGRSTQTFLVANGFDVLDDHIEGFIRYLIGGSVLYYPQLSSISSYQLYVEVVCEELDWLPFYPGISAIPKQSHGHKQKREGPPNAEAIPQALEVCSHWMQSFIKYSKWPENPSNVKATRFLSKGHNKLIECMEELGLARKITESSNCANGRAGSGISSSTSKETDSFDKALESVEEALIRLEKLLQELHVSGSKSGKEQLRAAWSELEKIRKLKKEAEFLEASFSAKAASLRQGDEEGNAESNQQQKPSKWRRDNSKFQGIWNFILPYRTKKDDILEGSGASHIGQNSSVTTETESNEIHRFELLRNELMELERRVQKSTNHSEIEKDNKVADESSNYNDDAGSAQLVQVQKKETLIGKSLDKLKETTTDVWQGTQLLAIDVAASMELLRRLLIGDELTEKEKKALRRTMTDLASVVPIGVLMLLPVTAVGHAAMLAAIQRYVPSLIPSTYGSERLDLLRQLEKVKEMEVSEKEDDEANEEKLA